MSNIFFNWTTSKLRKLQENVCTPGIRDEFLLGHTKQKFHNFKNCKIKKKELLNLGSHILHDFVNKSQMFCEGL